MKRLLFIAVCLAIFLSGNQSEKRDFSNPAKTPPPPAGAVGFPSRDPGLDALPGFQNPPPGYGEVAFYWWLGDPLTKERLSWQLDQLGLVRGVMGLQINYAHGDRGGLTWGLTYPSDPPLFSDAWWDLFRWFEAEAKKRGLAVSLSDYTLSTPGQGFWTDEIIAENPGIRGSVLGGQSLEVPGGGPISWDIEDHPLTVTAYRMKEGAVDPAGAVDLRPHVRSGKLEWNAPEGRWKLVAVSARTAAKSIDPMNPISGKLCVEKFFQRFEDASPGESGKSLNFFFSDELDFGVSGKLWNDRFAGEFRRRKGYDLIPELPALFEDIGPRTPKVRLDYSDVMVALSEENYFRPIFDWHQQRGMIYGCDHGGRGRNVVEFGDYFRTQRWNQGPGCDQPGLARDLIKNKVAASIAHLYERPRVWLEGFYGSGWGTDTARLVDATFANFAQGQNLLTLHGLYYSTHGGWWEWAPPCNHFRMPYWPHMDEFFGCVERLSYLLSQGVHRCDVAIVYPVAPMEAGLGGEDSVKAAFELGEYLYGRGIDFDFIDFESLARAKVENQELRVSGETYRALVLPAMRAARFSTVEKAAEFKRGGGLVIALGALPEASDRTGRNDDRLDDLVKETFGGPHNKYSIQTREQAADLIAGSFVRDFECLPAERGGGPVHFMHRRVGTRDVYMVYGAPKDSVCRFRASGKIELWDPWTGEKRPLRGQAEAGGITRVAMPLTEKEAQVIVFSPTDAEGADDRSESLERVDFKSTEILPLDGPWEFELKPTLDNRFGDFRWPPSPALIGAEARRFRYTDETPARSVGPNPDFDDARLPSVSASFGPQFWKLGPLPVDIDAVDIENRLARFERIDPSVSVEIQGKVYSWVPYSFSWRWGIEGDPGHQGYHGLKSEVHDEFIGLGKRTPTSTSASYEKEEGGTRYYLWTSAFSKMDGPGEILAGGSVPEAVWLNGKKLDQITGKVSLRRGANPLLLRYDAPGRSYFVIKSSSGAISGRNASPAKGDLASRWTADPEVLPFEIWPGEANPAGWYYFLAPPGLRRMTFAAHGKIQAWADGKEMDVTAGERRGDGARAFRATIAQPIPGQAKVALRIEQDRGYYGGAAIPEPISLDCGPGRIALGDWSKMGAIESYSGGAWYRRTIELSDEQTAGRVILDLRELSSSAEVRVNGARAGMRVSPPWTFDLTRLVRPGENRLEILILSSLGGHYSSLPTRYHGSLVSGLLGPVRLITRR